MEGAAVDASVGVAGDAAIGVVGIAEGGPDIIGALGTGVVRVLVGAVFIRGPAEPVTVERIEESAYPDKPPRVFHAITSTRNKITQGRHLVHFIIIN
jgi:hypothetical protein